MEYEGLVNALISKITELDGILAITNVRIADLYSRLEYVEDIINDDFEALGRRVSKLEDVERAVDD